MKLSLGFPNLSPQLLILNTKEQTIHSEPNIFSLEKCCSSLVCTCITWRAKMLDSTR
jgi:hypothetical protein